jgi:hypothetical protein
MGLVTTHNTYPLRIVTVTMLWYPHYIQSKAQISNFGEKETVSFGFRFNGGTGI